MVFLGLLQSGGLVLGQAMEQVTGGNLPSTLLIACAFTLSLVYLFRLAVGHMVQLPAGAVRAPQGSSFCAWVSLAVEGGWGPGWWLPTPVLQAVLIFAFGSGVVGIRIRGCAGRRSFCRGSN